MIETITIPGHTIRVLYNMREVALYIVPHGQNPKKSNCAIVLPRDAKRKTDDPNVILVNAIARGPALLTQLKHARECIGWCRKHHDDAQKGSGMPIEAFIDAEIAAAEGRSQ